ncbi:MAG: hypothetical protein LBI57_07590 [Helicobacteraceae bacterium]|jgi:prophage antirepressor-like protein|nr:hypothetical protein [Helicobacteraceae bacterium]
MNDLVNFTYEGREVRTVIKDGEPWWVGKDVAGVLGYPKTSNPARLFAHVPDEWKGRYPIPTPISEVNPIHPSSRARKSQSMLCLSEPGLYFFLARSDKDAALPFQKWIAGEVIPSIRKTGTYTLLGQEAWKEPSTVRIHELRMILNEGRISVREFRRLAFNFDTPDVPDNPIKGALSFKTHDDFMEYAETHKKANPTIYNFAKMALKITGNPDDYVLVRDLYRLYQDHMNTWKAETRNIFVRRIKELYPALEYKQKKVYGKPELVFMGCALADCLNGALATG